MPETVSQMTCRALCLLLFALLLLIACNASTNEPRIDVENIWSRPAMISAGTDSVNNAGYNGVIYLTIRNSGGVSDRLLKAKTDVCLVTEIHKSFVEDNRMMMERVSGGIEIPAGGSVKLEPGSYHLMLMGLKRSLNEGHSFAVQLKFEKSGIMTVYSKIKKF
jgi:copper(I)-binding protein